MCLIESWHSLQAGPGLKTSTLWWDCSFELHTCFVVSSSMSNLQQTIDKPPTTVLPQEEEGGYTVSPSSDCGCLRKDNHYYTLQRPTSKENWLLFSSKQVKHMMTMRSLSAYVATYIVGAQLIFQVPCMQSSDILVLTQQLSEQTAERSAITWQSWQTVIIMQAWCKMTVL
jgi:hypothetical protein